MNLKEKVINYRTAMSVIKSMLDENIITTQDYTEIDTIIAKECGLSSSSIFRDYP